MFCTRVACVCLLLCKEECSSPVYAITGCILGDLVFVCVGFWDGDYICQLAYVRYNVVVKNSFNHTREEYESKRAHVF